MEVRSEIQVSTVAGEVSSLIAIVRPILTGILYATKGDIIKQIGGYENATLEMLARVYRPGDGDCGICYEYAIHDAINRKEGDVVDRIHTATKLINVKGRNPSSILFGAEKTGAIQLIDTAKERLNDDSRVLSGVRAQPAKLKNYINQLAAAFRRPTTRLSLPTSISGLWKADLFIGYSDTDRWVGTTVKVNRTALEGAKGLRIGFVPADQGKSDKIIKDEGKNLVICPLPYDGSFMEKFYQAFGIVQAVIKSDCKMPKEVMLPRPPERYVAQQLIDRATYPVLDVVEALATFAQPELLSTHSVQKSLVNTSDIQDNKTTTLIAPISAKV